MRNTGVSPLRRQSAPPSVEMTIVNGWLGQDRLKDQFIKGIGLDEDRLKDRLVGRVHLENG
jgi:hypothetical protein